MIIGGLLGGILGDRIGRSAALLASVTCFSVLTALVALVDGTTTLTLARFLAGLGLGGAMPNAAALTAEFVPRRQRPIAITLTIVCIPVGGVLAGLAAGQIIPAYGWRVLFAAGGVGPLIVALLLFKLLPESPRFLARVRARWPELRSALRRMGHPVDEDAIFVESADAGDAPRGSIAQLFAPALRRDTLALVGAFGSCLLAIWMAFLWIPAMLTDPAVGFTQPDASCRAQPVQLRWRRRCDRRRLDHSEGRFAAGPVDDGGACGGVRARDVRDPADPTRLVHGDGDVRGLRRAAQRRAGHDVCVGRARVSHRNSRHGRRRNGGGRASRECGGVVRRDVGAIRRWPAPVFPDLGGRHGRGVPVSRHHQAAHSVNE